MYPLLERTIKVRGNKLLVVEWWRRGKHGQSEYSDLDCILFSVYKSVKYS